MRLVLAILLVTSSLSFAGPPMTQQEAEKLARAQWFEFELEEVKTTWKGDWVAFVRAKEAKERALDEEAKKQSSLDEPNLPARELRARRVLQEEFTAVAQKREDELRALARKVIEAMAKGDLETLAADCTMYSSTAPDRLALTRKYLEGSRAKLQAAAKLVKVDAGDFAVDLQFESPEPEAGMTGQVLISFGPKAAPPKDKDLYPERHQLEFWWSGEVMPDANGPRNASPTSPRPVSRWRFHQLITPFSLRPMLRQ